MKKLQRIVAVFLLAIIYALAGSAQPLADNVHNVLFLGNSITYAGSYITDIEAYFLTRHPNAQIEFINAGLPSETVSGLSEQGHAGGRFPRPDLHERLQRVLDQTHPDVVFACYGMNDGIYLPLDTARFGAFKSGIQWLHDQLVKTGARIIHLTPLIYDELRGPDKGYASVLDTYSDWLLSQKGTAGWEVADLHYPMKKYLDAHRAVDVQFAVDGFALATDGVHPGDVGHWIMAKSILLYLGEKGVAPFSSVKAALSSVPNGDQILQLVSQRQLLMKDAWLTATGHKRPEMKTGLPLKEAQLKAEQFDRQIRALLQ
jgi:lysophospholipase L1-like esterase